MDDGVFARNMAEFAPFEPGPQIAVAVSGGADSMALALLAGQWAKARGGRAIALTVDHGLRPESAAEAQWVARQMAAQGFEHHILPWQGEKPQADVQAAARQARYALLTEFCRQHGVLHLLLAHHRQDQGETFLLRLGRGSGVEGLSAMAACQEVWSVRLLRPLLAVDKAELQSLLRRQGWQWVEDPSNDNGRFQRVQWRQQADRLQQAGLSWQRLAETAGRLNEARQALEPLLSWAMTHSLELHPAGFAWIDWPVLAACPAHIVHRLFSRLLSVVAGRVHGPRHDALSRLIRACGQADFRAATLGGCRVVRHGHRLLVCRELRACADRQDLAPGTEQIWDGRVRVTCPAGLGTGWQIGPLGPQGWRRIGRGGPSGQGGGMVPAEARATIPAFFFHQVLSAVPLLGYKQFVMEDGVSPDMLLTSPLALTQASHHLVSRPFGIICSERRYGNGGMMASPAVAMVEKRTQGRIVP